MIQSERVYHLENLTFILSKNMDGFAVQRITFSSPQANEAINGILKGEGIRSGKFIGKFIAPDLIELFFQYFDGSSLHFVTGKIFGFLCGDPSRSMHIFLNWYCLHGKRGYGAASYTQLQ